MLKKERKVKKEKKSMSELVTRSLNRSNCSYNESNQSITRESNLSKKVSEQMSEKKVAEVSEVSKAIKEKLAKYSKLQFSESSHHDCEFNRDNYTDEKANFKITDKKYYKSSERADTLEMSRDEINKRLEKVALFDRDSFVEAFEKEATFILCCNSKAVTLNLTHHERQYSTLYRHLALYSNRADLYLMTMMSDKQREQAFNSTHFNRAIEKQALSLSIEQIKKADTNNKKYNKVVEQFKALLIAIKSNKKVTATVTEKKSTAKLIKAKAEKKLEKAVAVK